MTDLMVDFKRKALFIILTLCLIFSVSKAVNAEETAFTGVPETAIGNLKYSITADGHLTVTGTGNYGSSPAWSAYKDYIVKATVNVTDITQTTNMFSYCSKLESVDLSGLDTSKVTSMALMFNDCSSLQSVEVSHFDTRNVTDMSYMFCGCSSLKSLVVKGTNFSTSKVTEMDRMFAGCKALESIDVSGFDLRQVETMEKMFFGCSSLKTLDLSGLQATNVTNMVSAFARCSGLETINLTGFTTSSVEDLMYLFNGDTSLKNITFDKSFDTKNVTSMYGMFQECTGLESVDLRYFNTGKVESMMRMFDSCSSLKQLDLKHFNTGSLTATSRMFYGCSSLETLDLSNFNMSSVRGMFEMFAYCSNLKTLDISGFDTSSAVNMLSYFQGCSNLAEIKVNPDTFKTDNVTNFSYMFNGCEKLLSFDFSKFNTSSATEMKNMFTNCNSIKEINLSSFVTTSAPTVFSISAENLEKFTSGKEKRQYRLRTTAAAWRDEKGTRYANDAAIELEPNTTLYRLNATYNIDYVYEGELEDAQTTYKLDQTLVLTGVVNHEHYTFEGWYKDAKFTEAITEIPAGTYGDITVYAKMTPKTYSITYMNMDDVTNAEKLPVSYVYGKTTPIAVPLKVCYLFDGWYTDEKLTVAFDKITKTTGGDLVLYASWKPNHDLDKENGVVLKEATTIEEGQIRYQCKNCDYTETETVPRLVTDESQIDDDDIINNPNDGDIEGSDFSKIQVWANKTTQKSIRIKWNKIEGADGYKVYGNNCGKKNRCELLKDIKNVKKTSWTYKKLKKGKYYKFIVRAYKVVDGQEITLAVSKTIHVATNGGKKGNAKAVDIKTDRKMKKTSSGYTLTLKKNKSYTINAQEVAKDKKISRHRNIRFVSTDKEVATVTSKGVVKTKKAGTCFIYVYAQNGVYKKVKVVVK